MVNELSSIITMMGGWSRHSIAGGESKDKCMKTKKVNCSTHWNIPNIFSLFLFVFVCCSPCIYHYISAWIESTQHRHETQWNSTYRLFLACRRWFQWTFPFKILLTRFFMVESFSFFLLFFEALYARMKLAWMEENLASQLHHATIHDSHKSRFKKKLFESIYGNVAKQPKV